MDDSLWEWDTPLPVLIGGAPGPTLFAHIAEFGEGWIPIGGHGLGKALPQLRAAMEAAGRDPATAEVVPFGSIPHPAKLEYFERIGVTQCIFRLPSAPESVVMPLLDRYAALVSEMGASA